MVKITQQYLIRHSDRLLPSRLKNESDTEFLCKITHLKLQGRYIDQFDKIPNCKNVAYLYLQNNLLNNIQNLDCFTKLTHLYLQRNKINKLENFNNLINLKKLYLGYNEISVIENLDNCRVLKELHLENQFLPMGESLYFDPRCTKSLSGCLEVLNVANNGLFSLASIANLHNLTELNVIGNKLSNDKDLEDSLQLLPKLQTIKIQGNPISLQRNLKDLIIIFGKSVKYLDNSEINDKTRCFVEGWYKSNRRGKKSVQESLKIDLKSETFALKEGKTFAQVQQQLPNSDISKMYIYQPWKLRKNIQAAPQIRKSSIKLKYEPLERSQSHHVKFN